MTAYLRNMAPASPPPERRTKPAAKVRHIHPPLAPTLRPPLTGGWGGRRRGPPGDIQGQDPAALGFGYRHQPLVLPPGHDPVLGHAGRHTRAGGPLRTGARLGA